MVCVSEWMMVSFIETENTGEQDLNVERKCKISVWEILNWRSL